MVLRHRRYREALHGGLRQGRYPAILIGSAVLRLIGAYTSQDRADTRQAKE